MSTFYKRRILDVIHRRIRTTPVVILEGPRAVGKSTLLREIAGASNAGIIDLDEVDVKHRVESDPQGYVSRRRPVLVDEYPKVPDLLQHIKAQLNKDGAPGQFVLTGSASREANRPGLNALVGRHVAIPILPLAQSEIGGRGGNFVEEVFGDVEAIRSSGPSNTTREDYIRKVLTGGFPLMLRSLDLHDRHQRFKHYVDQCINYGLTNLYEIREREHLERLLHRYAAQTGQILNIRGAASDVELKRGTAENYTRLLELLFLIHRLPAWKATDQGPLSRPKLHVVDSGVGGRLLRLTEERIGSGAPLFRRQYGHLLETFVVGEVRKMITWMDGTYGVGYWPNREGDEVDLVVERSEDEAVIGLEVKAAARVRSRDWKGLRLLRDQIGSRFRAGLVMYTGDMPYRLDERIYAMPIDKLWAGAPDTVTDRIPAPTGESASPARRTEGERLLTADGDPLPEPVRLATDEMIDRMEIGEAAYWEVAAVPSAIVHFGDFYTTAGVAGELHGYPAWPGGETEPIGQCVASVRTPGRSPLGYETPATGALVHPLGSMVFIVSAVPDPPREFSESRFVTLWSTDLVRFMYTVLAPHPTTWTIWSAGRRMRSGDVRFVGNPRDPHRGPPTPGKAVVNDPPHRGIPSTGEPEIEARLLRVSFYEWFGIPASDLPEVG